MACDTTALSGVACHTRWDFFPQLCNDMDLKNVKRFTVKSTSRPSLRCLPCSCFAFLYSPRYILLLKGDIKHPVQNQKLQGKESYSYADNHFATPQTSQFLVLGTPAAVARFSISFSWGYTYWLCIFQKKLHCISYCAIILQKLHPRSKKEQWNDKTQEREEFKHML